MTTTIEHATNAELHRKCAAILLSRGWLVVEACDVKMETPRQVGARFNLKPSTLCKRLKAFTGSFPKTTGPTGRIRHLHVTPELTSFLANKHHNQ